MIPDSLDLVRQHGKQPSTDNASTSEFCGMYFRFIQAVLLANALLVAPFSSMKEYSVRRIIAKKVFVPVSFPAFVPIFEASRCILPVSGYWGGATVDTRCSKRQTDHQQSC